MGWKTPGAVLACTALLAGCDARNDPAPAPASSETSVIPELTEPDPPLDREALLLAVLRVASAAASGSDTADSQRDLDGKRFRVRLRFGCPGDDVGPSATRTWAFDESQSVVRLEIAPEIEGDAPLVQEVAGPEIEAVEGFWIPRPWLLHAACPVPAPAPPVAGDQTSPGAAADDRASRPRAAQAGASGPPPGSAPAQEPQPWLGIAQFFTESDARTHRRDSRAYQAAENLSADESPSASGYDLVVAGRLQSLPDGRVIACRANGAQQPSCIISARFEQVSLERGDTGEVLAEWPRG